MSKVQDLMTAYPERIMLDPNDAEAVIIAPRISVKMAAIEFGGVEEVSKLFPEAPNEAPLELLEAFLRCETLIKRYVADLFKVVASKKAEEAGNTVKEQLEGML